MAVFWVVVPCSLGGHMENSSHHVQNSVEFINTIKSLRAGPEDILISFNVTLLFTKVSIGEALHLLSCHVDQDILRLFHHILTSSFFSFIHR
jgi:hypothetical protein